MFDIFPISSLERAFPDIPFIAEKLTKGSMLKNEYYSFQFAYRLSDSFNGSNLPVSIKVDHNLGESLSVRFVDYVPCDFAMYEHAEGPIEHKMPGLFPDILKPMPSQIWAYKNVYRCIWITIDGENNGLTPGEYEIAATISIGEHSSTSAFTINVLNKELPKQKLICTNWFHTDCLCNYYNIEFDSEEYWQITKNFATTASKYGINMLLTPIFTPPLDTAVGQERRTIQLIDIYKDKDKYSFKFDKLIRWVNMCVESNIEYFEMSHLFTQWGCKHAPKIMGYENGEYKRLFGWETDGHGKDYKHFLSVFLPQLVKVLKELEIADKCYFHVSDEPSNEVLEDYRDSSNFLKEHLDEFHMFDALSSIEFYKEGLIDCPIPALDHISSFIEAGVKDLWTYYCCGQVNVSNRFLAFPSSRNRLLGLILFKYDIAGFLQWGFNFYNTHVSLSTINPYEDSTARGWVPGGDTFVVYPGHDGDAIASVRLEVFREAIQDMRVLQALADKIGKKRVLEIIEKNIETALSHNTNNIKANELINIREIVNTEY